MSSNPSFNDELFQFTFDYGRKKCVKFVLEVVVIWYIWHIYVIPSCTVMINCFVDK
jgi:hypothetical protein